MGLAIECLSRHKCGVICREFAHLPRSLIRMTLRTGFGVITERSQGGMNGISLIRALNINDT